MLGNNQEVRNRKPRSEGEAHLQGRKEVQDANNNYTATTELKASCSRYDKGMELYKSESASIGSNFSIRFQDLKYLQRECNPIARIMGAESKPVSIYSLIVEQY